MKKFRIVALAMAIVLMLACLVSCGGAKEKITVPIQRPAKAYCGNKTGRPAYTKKPKSASKGILFTVLVRFILWEKKESARSTKSWVKKFTSTKNPKREKEIPYSSRKVRNKMGDKQEVPDMVILAL